jgi:hypothetical protein
MKAAEALEQSFLGQFADLDLASVQALSEKLMIGIIPRLAPELADWLGNELAAELELRLDLKAGARKLPDLAAWPNGAIGRALVAVAEAGRTTLSPIEDEFLKSLVHLLSAHAAVRLAIGDAAT